LNNPVCFIKAIFTPVTGCIVKTGFNTGTALLKEKITGVKLVPAPGNGNGQTVVIIGHDYEFAGTRPSD
jgi:hypothetical protein